MAYQLVNIQLCKGKRADGTDCSWYELLCLDSYAGKNLICGQPTKIIKASEYCLAKALDGDITKNAPDAVGKSVYVMYNDKGYTAFLRFYDPDDKSGTAASQSVPAAGSSDPYVI